MIKESIKEIMGDHFIEEMIDSSDDESYRAPLKKVMAETQKLNRSKSSSQISRVKSDVMSN